MLTGRDVVVEEAEEEVELDDAEDEHADDAEVDRPAPARRRSRGRRPLPENLPRVEIEVLPPEVVREGLDAFQWIGQVVNEVVERRPAPLVVAHIVRPKFVRKGEMTGTVDADAPEAPAVQIARTPRHRSHVRPENTDVRRRCSPRDSKERATPRRRHSLLKRGVS
ncbi:hypothetical protein [Nannocystis pusilla]|uniref:IS66 family transposase n=1 Tax=Nannocystis pusilla TaxID=889268 RepID=UPI003B7B9D2D